MSASVGAAGPRALGLAALLLAGFMDLADGTMLLVALPVIAGELGLGPAQVRWTVAGYTLALGAGLILGGRTGDVLGRRRVFLAGLVGGTLAAVLTALAPSAALLIAGRLLSGVAAAFTVPMILGIIRASLDEAARARVLAAYGVTLGVAALVGPILGGAMVSEEVLGLGWRAIFWLNAAVGVATLALSWASVPESRGEEAAHDLPGAGLLVLSACLAFLPLLQGVEQGGSAWALACLAGAALAAGLLVLRARTVRFAGGRPILDLTAFRSRRFGLGLLAALLFFGGLSSSMLALVLYLQDGTGRTPWETGLVLLPNALASFVTSGLAIPLAQRFGGRSLAAGAGLLAASLALLLALLSGIGEPGAWGLALVMAVSGLGVGLVVPALVNVVLAAVEARDAGAAAGLLDTMVQFGAALGVAGVTAVFFASLAGREGAAAYSAALAATLPWLVGAALAAAGLLLALPYDPRSPRPG